MMTKYAPEILASIPGILALLIELIKLLRKEGGSIKISDLGKVKDAFK